MEKIVAGSVMLSLGLLMVPPAFAVSSVGLPDSAVLVASSPSGPWSAGKTVAGEWITTRQEYGAIVTLPGGVTAKLAKGSTVHIDDSPATHLSGLNGRVFLHVARAGSPVAVDMGSVHVVASQGEMVVDSAAATKLTVLSGDATMQVTTASVAPRLKKTKAKLVALDGPDVRSRNTEQDEFNRRRKRKKGASYHKKPVTPHTPPVTPPVTPPPVTPPTVTPPTTVTPPPPGPPVVVAPAGGVAGAATPWIVLGSLLVVGGAVALAVTQTHNNGITTPASP